MKSFLLLRGVSFLCLKWWFNQNFRPFELPTIIVDIPHAKNIQVCLYAHNRWLTHRLNKLAAELLH